MAPKTHQGLDLHGFWGPPTATIDWCEYNYEVSYYIAEFWNTITNLWMIIPPLYGIHSAIKQNFEKRYILCYLSLLTIGIGSWLFHMTLRYDMQLLDEIPMVFGSSILLYCIYETRQPTRVNLPLMVSLIVYCLFFCFVYLNIPNPLFHEIIYGVLVVIMVWLDTELTIKLYSRANLIMLIVGIAMYGLGFFLWNVDNNFCQELRQLRQDGSIPMGLEPLTQLHGWWHILAGYSTYIQIVAVIQQRLRFRKRRCQYEWGLVGITVTDLDLPKTKKKSK